MVRNIVLFTFLFFTLINSLIFAQSETMDSRIIETVMGDLDGDNIPEKVVARNTTDSSDMGFIRELMIYKKKDLTWILWKSSRNALFESEGGGMMGDPFASMVIEKGILIINQAGGSRWKWSNTDKYRYQKDEFQLIGYSTHFGTPCEYWLSFDFNVSTGKINYLKEYESCEDDNTEPIVTKTEKETFRHTGIQLTLENRYPCELIITSPKYKETLHL